jgi:nitroreductase
MPVLDLSADELLTTTRAVRKRLDLTRTVEIDVVKECLELAIQAPSGSNAQGWHFIVVTDGEKKQKIAEFYRTAFKSYRDQPRAAGNLHQDDPVLGRIQQRIVSSAEYLAEHLEKVPVFMIPCIEGRIEQISGRGAVVAQASTYGSILPAVWSFMLAARSRGLGTCWTTLHLVYEKQVAEILGVPFEAVTQVALIPVAYTLGTAFKPAARKSVEGVLHLEGW